MTMTGKRWPLKPPIDTRCEAIVDTDYSTGNPRLIRCANLAAETVKSKLGIFSEYLCHRCAQIMEEKGSIVRNPKRN